MKSPLLTSRQADPSTRMPLHPNPAHVEQVIAAPNAVPRGRLEEPGIGVIDRVAVLPVRDAIHVGAAVRSEAVTTPVLRLADNARRTIEAVERGLPNEAQRDVLPQLDGTLRHAVVDREER